MHILAIDTSQKNASIALMHEGAVLDIYEKLQSNQQAEKLFMYIEQMLGSFGIGYREIAAVGVNIGPGSFTGVRLGLAAANGIALAQEISVIGVTSFESVFDRLSSPQGSVLIALDARREQVFLQQFQDTITQPSEAILVSLDEIEQYIPTKNFILAGSATTLIQRELTSKDNDRIVFHADNLPDARNIASVAYQKYRMSCAEKEVFPLYIREPDAKKSTNLPC